MASQTSPSFQSDGPEVVVKNITEKCFSGKKPPFLIKIIKYVCALLNTIGAMRYILFDCHDLEFKDIDNFKQRIENKLKAVFGPTVLYDYVSMHNVNDGNVNGFICEVKPGNRLCTIEYNMYLPASSQLIEMTAYSFENVVEIMRNDLEKSIKALKKEERKEFTEGKKFGRSESDQIQFKCFKENETDEYNVEGLSHKIENSHLSHYLSAFANHEGGRLYYGIEDKENKIKGHELRLSDEHTLQNNEIVTHREFVTDTIKRIIVERMVWGKGEPKQGEDWDVQYIPVRAEDGKSKIENRFVIVVSVRYFPNGVFSQPPESYKLENGEPFLIEYQEWHERVQVGNDCYHRYMNIDIVDQSARSNCCKIIDKVDKMIDSGKDRSDVVAVLNEEINSQIEKSENTINPEIVTCRLQLAYQYYAVDDVENAESNLEEVDRFFKSEELKKNRTVLEFHYSCLRASLARKKGNLDESLRLTYDCLVETDEVRSGWENAIVWKTHGRTLAEMACSEEDPYRKRKRKRDAEYAWCKAIKLAQKVVLTRHIPREEKIHAAICPYAYYSVLPFIHRVASLRASAIRSGFERRF